MSRSLVPVLLTVAVLAIPATAAPPARKAGAGHHTKLMSYVEVPVDHGLWLTPETPCSRVSNVDSPLMWFPAPPAEDKFLSCSPGMKQIGPATYQDILCPAPNASAPSTYKVISRTRMLMDGEPIRLCPVAQLPEPFRSTVMEQLARERSGH
jgi:hypothetical protein